MHCGTPFCKQGLTYHSGHKSQGPRGPAASGHRPPGLQAGDKPGYFHHFLPPTRAAATIGCHLSLAQDSSGHRKGCRLQTSQVSGPPYYPAPPPTATPTQVGRWDGAWQGKEASHPARLCSPSAFPSRRQGWVGALALRHGLLGRFI